MKIFCHRGRGAVILGIGTDIVEVSRVARSIGSEAFLARVYTRGEREYADARGRGRAASYAARWAGKEAVLKALGTGLREGELREIEILPDALGAPEVRLYGRFKEIFEARGVEKIWLSLSHSKEYATAQCVLER